jgi:hypothetical protein
MKSVIAGKSFDGDIPGMKGREQSGRVPLSWHDRIYRLVIQALGQPQRKPWEKVILRSLL